MKETYMLNGLCCANCAAKIERKVEKLPGVQSANVNFMLQKLIIEAEENSVQLASLTELVHKIEPDVQVERVV